MDLATALEQPILLMSREMARLEQNAAVVLAAPKWDLVLLDEAHAARRASQVETEFNSATLLLELLRNLQLQGRARGLLLLSATPMQTHPWEPWDLMGVLGEGAPWLADFGVVRTFYESLAGADDRPVPMERGRAIAHDGAGGRGISGVADSSRCAAVAAARCGARSTGTGRASARRGPTGAPDASQHTADAAGILSAWAHRPASRGADDPGRSLRVNDRQSARTLRWSRRRMWNGGSRSLRRSGPARDS